MEETALEGRALMMGCHNEPGSDQELTVPPPPVEMLPAPNTLYELCRGQTLPVPGRRTGPDLF